MPSVSPARSLRRIKSRAFAIEAALLKGAVGALTNDRAACRGCGRTPLVGERVYRFEAAGVVCELCRPAEAGEPLDSALVRSPERRSVTPLRGRE